MTKIYELPKKARRTDTLGLHLTFQEVKIRGTDDVRCQVHVQEEGRDGFEVNQTYHFKSWEAMQEKFPTLLDFLYELAENQHWDSEWREYDRIYFIESSEGHEGLYKLTKTVWFDAREKLD